MQQKNAPADQSSLGQWWQDRIEQDCRARVILLCQEPYYMGDGKKKPPPIRRTAVDGGKGHRVGWRLPIENLTTEGVVKEIEKRSRNSTVVFGKSVIKDEFHELTHNLGKTLN